DILLGTSDASPVGVGPAWGEPGLRPRIVVGMPHLAFGGLSENWLWKECGHRHWVALANRFGLAQPDFRDARGNRLYAAFTAVRLRDGNLSRVAEGAALVINSSIARVSQTQHVSEHHVTSAGQNVSQVMMASAFVRRTLNGSNRHVERAVTNAAP